MHRRVLAIGSGMLLAVSLAGPVSADPNNVNSRYFSANCDGEIVDFVTKSGGAAQVLGDTRVAVLRAATQDGTWIIPFTKGHADDTDIVECVYTQLFGGHQFVIYVSFN